MFDKAQQCRPRTGKTPAQRIRAGGANRLPICRLPVLCMKNDSCVRNLLKTPVKMTDQHASGLSFSSNKWNKMKLIP
jgi:hypothetical protein